MSDAPVVAERPATPPPAAPRRGPIDLPFDPILDAEAPRTRWPIIVGLVFMVGFFGGFMLWATTAPLAEAAIAPGVIKVEGTRRTLAHLEGGIVREILVRDGTRVEAGQVVMRLDDIQASSALEALRAQRFSLLAQDARLDAEAAAAREVSFPALLTGSDHARAAEVMAGQRALFEARQASITSQVLVLETRVAQQLAIIGGAQGQLAASRRQLALIRQEEVMRRGLVNQGLARLPELLALQRAVAGLEGQIVELNGQVARAEGAIAEAERGIQQVRSQRRQEVSAELREVAARLAEAEERIRAAEDVAVRREITAPEAGTIINLRHFTVGAAIRAGDPVMDLVPVRDRLVAEVNVQPFDIDAVYPGLQAEIRLPAFKQRLVPYLHGRVTFVAADVTTDQATRATYFRAYIEIDEQQLARLPAVFLVPGMPVEAHVQIGQRSFWRYMTQPIRDSLHRAFREQ